MVVVFGVIHHHAPFLLLRDVHGDVGMLQQRLRIGAVRAGDDYADAGVDVEFDAFDPEGFAQGLTQARGHIQSAAQTIDVRQQHCKFIAAQPSNRICPAQRAGQPRADLSQ